jgi:hypothetical protein
MNLPFILDLTKSQHPCITEELQKQTFLHDKYNQTCQTLLAPLLCETGGSYSAVVLIPVFWNVKLCPWAKCSQCSQGSTVL